MDSGAAQKGAGGVHPFPAPGSVPCTEVEPLGLLLLDHPERTGVGGDGQRCVRSPRVIANSKEGRKEGRAGGRGRGR